MIDYDKKETPMKLELAIRILKVNINNTIRQVLKVKKKLRTI